MVIPVTDFLGLQPDPAAPLTFRLPVTERLLNAGGTLWGGVGLSAFAAAGEQAVGRRCVWATVQYLTPIRAGEELAMRIDIGGEGISMTQASGHGTVNGKPALLAVGTFGGDGPYDLQFSPAPDFPPPGECEERKMPFRFTTGLVSHVEQRTVPGMGLPHEDGSPGTGRTTVWMRLHDGSPERREVVHGVGSLAVLADLAPSGSSEAIGRPTLVSSLDNSIRAARLPEETSSGWVLMDITVEAVVGRVAQLSARMFDEDGRLLAVAGQSARLRTPRKEMFASEGS